MLNALLVTGSNFEARETKIKALVKQIFAPTKIDPADVIVWNLNTLTASKKKLSLVKQIKNQLQWLSFSAHNLNGVKIWIIYKSELLSIPAQNALLKTLEEPLNNRYIILESQNRDQLLKTILSRTEIFTLSDKAPPETKGWSWLEKNIHLNYGQLATLAERLALQDREKIKKFLQECQENILNSKSQKQPSQLFSIFSFSLKGLNHNVNAKHLLINLFWQIKKSLAKNKAS